MAVATSAMLRTWPVRLEAIEFTLSVRSFHVPATPGTCAWPPSLPSVPTSRATRVTSEAKERSWSTIVLMVSFSSQDFAAHVHGDLLATRSPLATAIVTSAMLRTWPVRLAAIEFTLSVRSFQVPATPGTCGLAAELAFGAHLARHAGHFGGEGVELVHHRVDGVLQLEDFALHVHGDLAATGRRCATAVVTSAMLRTWPVRFDGHRVHVVGEILPRAGHAGHLRLAAELAFGADFARHAASLRRRSR